MAVAKEDLPYGIPFTITIDSSKPLPENVFLASVATASRPTAQCKNTLFSLLLDIYTVSSTLINSLLDMNSTKRKRVLPLPMS